MFRPIVISLTALLLLSCSHDVSITAQTTGRVAAVLVQPGAYVHIGDVLVQLDTRDLVTRRQTLIARIDLAELRHTDASALYRALEETNLEMTRRTITSPVSGRVVWICQSRTIHQGMQVAVVVEGPPIAQLVAKKESAGGFHPRRFLKSVVLKD